MGFNIAIISEDLNLSYMPHDVINWKILREIETYNRYWLITLNQSPIVLSIHPSWRCGFYSVFANPP